MIKKSNPHGIVEIIKALHDGVSGAESGHPKDYLLFAADQLMGGEGNFYFYISVIEVLKILKPISKDTLDPGKILAVFGRGTAFVLFEHPIEVGNAIEPAEEGYL